ncbi:MAG: ATP-binding protein [Actinobacteria bacterium]|nr:ATP-binding protein [Actinomycetota bacterium]
MPIWRSPDLEALLEASLDENGLTEAAIDRLVMNAVTEGEQLDFKFEPHLPESGKAPASPERGWSSEQEFAKDVCAFANHLGGLLLVGVKDDKGAAVSASPTVTDPSKVTQRLRQALSNYASPAPRFHPIPITASAGGHYLALIVPPSPFSPHAVRGATGNDRRPLHYPVRDGQDTRWLLEHEIAERYRARFAGRSELALLRDETLDKGLEALQRADHETWLYLAIVPEAPARHHLDRRTLEATTKWWRSDYGFSSPLERGFYFQGPPTPAPGRITISTPAHREDDEDADPRGNGYVELWVDGRAFVATPITANSSHEDPACIGERTLADDTIILTDLAVSWSCHQAGAWGTAEIVIGITKDGQVAGSFDEPLTLQSAEEHGLHRIRGTRPIRGPIQSHSVIDLSEGEDPAGRLQAARDALTVLVHHFGLPEPRQLEADGALLPWGWGDRRREVERWAIARGLPYQPMYPNSRR